MRNEHAKCAYCSKDVLIKHYTANYSGKTVHRLKVVSGKIITDGTENGGTPICKEHYGKIVTILTRGEIYFRNDKGQIQKF
jgi:hypothetical protein